MLFEHVEDDPVIGLVHVGIGELVAAGAELGCRGIGEILQLRRVLEAHIVKRIGQYAGNAVIGAQHLGDLLRVESGTNGAVGRSVDNGSRAAGLTDDAGADEFVCHEKITSKTNVFVDYSTTLV